MCEVNCSGLSRRHKLFQLVVDDFLWYRFEVNKEILTYSEQYLSNATSLFQFLNN